MAGVSLGLFYLRGALHGITGVCGLSFIFLLYTVQSWLEGTWYGRTGVFGAGNYARRRYPGFGGSSPLCNVRYDQNTLFKHRFVLELQGSSDIMLYALRCSKERTGNIVNGYLLQRVSPTW